jgi:transcriptional regulator with XRE-family HTH domain
MMETLSKQDLGKRLVQIRKSKGYSQEALAKLLDMSRPSLAQIELGNRNIDIFEIHRMASVLGFSIDELINTNESILSEPEMTYVSVKKTDTIRNNIPVFNQVKFINTFLYIVEKTAGMPNICEKGILGRLYLVDFNYYELHEAHLSSSKYFKRSSFPLPEGIDKLIKQFIENEFLIRLKTKNGKLVSNRIIPLVQSDLTELKASEKEVIDHVLFQTSNWSLSHLESYLQDDMPIKISKENEMIDYEFALYRESPYSVRNYESENI